MRAIVKGALIGGSVGALVTSIQATRADDDPPETVALAALKGAAEGALAGGLIGAFFDWRRARAEPEPTVLIPDAAVAAARDLIDTARPVVETAALEAQDRALAAVDSARPHVEAVAVQARGLALDAVEAARPHLQVVASRAQDRAWDVAERAAPCVLELIEEARDRAPAIVESTIGDGPIIVVRRPAA